MRRSRESLARFGFGVVLVAVVGILVTACTESDEEPFLVPTGEIVKGSGTLRGTLLFDGGPPTGEVIVYTLRDYVVECESQFTTIHPTGTFTEWDETRWSSTPGMKYLGGCVWVDQIELAGGSISWKFVTNKAWDNPADYTSVGQDNALTGATGTGGGDLTASVPAGDLYFLFLYEGTSPAAYAFLTEEEAPLTRPDESTGQFEVPDLPSGTYEIVVVAEGFLDYHVSVELGEDEDKELGQIEVFSATGVIRGKVAYSDNPDPLPKAFVEVLETGGTIAIAQDSTDAAGSFAIRGLTTGTYDLRISATGYVGELVADVEYVNGEEIELGTVTLSPGCSSAYDIIELLGEFNSWTASAPMTQIGACVWVDTVRVSVDSDPDSTYTMKFRTDGNWDSPLDYGTCTTQEEIHGLEGEVCGVSGEGTALAVKFPATGDYEFTFFEGTSTYRITILAQAEPGGITGTVVYEDDPAEIPATTVQLFRAGSPVPIGSTTVDEQGDYAFEDLAAGGYDLRLDAVGYQTGRVAGISVVEGETTAVEPIELILLSECVAATAIEIAAELTGWPSEGNGPHASLVGECQWAIQLPVDLSADDDSTFVFKFRTNEREGEDDYGSCVGSDFVYEFDGEAVTGQVCVVNGPIGNIKVKFPLTGNYLFYLDEQTRTFRIVLL